MGKTADLTTTKIIKHIKSRLEYIETADLTLESKVIVSRELNYILSICLDLSNIKENQHAN